MEPTSDSSAPLNGLPVESLFVRNRNVLLTRAAFSDLFVDYYLHLAEHQIRHSEPIDSLFKDLLAAFTLHCASRPKFETLAWTLNFQQPTANIFLAGDSDDCIVTGRVFTENVREADKNSFYQDLVKRGKPLHRSIVEFTEQDGLAAIEHFYAQSEQRPARIFRLNDENFVMACAHPDYDEAWFDALTTPQIQNLAQNEHLEKIETRFFRWHCGCSEIKILQVLKPVMQQDPTGLFGNDAAITVSCPRCAARYRITRETMEAFTGD